MSLLLQEVPADEKIGMDVPNPGRFQEPSATRQVSAGNSASGADWKPLRPSSLLQEKRPKQGQSSRDQDPEAAGPGNPSVHALGLQDQQGRRLEKYLPCCSMAHLCSLQLELYFVMVF